MVSHALCFSVCPFAYDPCGVAFGKIRRAKEMLCWPAVLLAATDHWTVLETCDAVYFDMCMQMCAFTTGTWEGALSDLGVQNR